MKAPPTQRSGSRSYLNRGAFLVAVAWVAAAVFAGSKPADEKTAKSSTGEENHAATDVVGDKGEQIREGTALTNQTGYFRLTGDRLTFFWSSRDRRLVGLENLNLERISKIVSQSREPLEWSISGIITEFQGGNYLLVTRAALKSPSAARAAARVPAASMR